MSTFITVKETNKQLSQGIVPSSLDYGFIPNAEQIEACMNYRKSKHYIDPSSMILKDIHDLNVYESVSEDLSDDESIYYESTPSKKNTGFDLKSKFNKLKGLVKNMTR